SPAASRALTRRSPSGARPARHRSAPAGIARAAHPVSRAEPRISTSFGKYVYCVIESSRPLCFGPIGLGTAPSEVYTVAYDRLAAVVSDAPPEILTRENVLAHERVNQAVMREHPLIPMSFGTVFRTREDVIELLRSTAREFGEVLDKMRDKV